MKKNTPSSWQISEIPLSMLVLVILLVYTFEIFVYIPYIGFYFHPINGSILEFYIPNHSALRPEDVLVKVGDISFKQYQADATQPLFTQEMKQGAIIPITINRGGNEISANWEIPGFNSVEFRGRLFNIWWLAYIFWIFGAIIELFIRPREIRWRLLIATNHLTGLWIMLGSFSGWHLSAGAILFHAVTWLLLPIYLHLNWVFLKPFITLQKISNIFFYSFGIVMFFGELIQAFSNSTYLWALVLTLGGSLLLQVAHFFFHREQRKQIGLLAIFTFLATLPLILVIIIGISKGIPAYAPVALLALILIPSIYIYLIVRTQLGGLERRANRFISTFSFLIIVGTILITVIHATTYLNEETSALLAFIIPLVLVVLSIRIFPAFEIFVEKNILGIKLPYQNLQEAYSNRITTSTSLPSLLKLLEEEVFPSLLIRQYAFMQVSNESLKRLLAKNVSANLLPEESGINQLIERSGNYIPNFSSTEEWIRLILPLKVGDSFIGFWLLGRRDPDDLYHQKEISILQAIANQTAIALSNILHQEKLRQIYQLGSERYEQESMRLGHELHDSVLQELADLRRNLGETNVSSDIQEHYQHVIDRLREIVNNIRPPMLTYGLSPAIKELADNLMQQAGDKIKIKVELQTTDERLAENIELHLFRIVQQACKNTLHHAQASNIKIYGSLSPQKAELTIEDDGIGFEIEEKLKIDTNLSNRHFGLAGIMERAYLIGAQPHIKSSPNAGTKIHVVWLA